MPFSYFGSKAKLWKYYSKPHYDTIIEPFCGAANYSIHYYDRDVWINDLWKPVIEIWRWIQQASKQDVKSLPELKYGERLSNIKSISSEERLLLRMCLSCGNCDESHDKMSKWAAGIRSKPRPNSHRSKDPSQIERTKRNILKIVGKISHWKITNLDYSELPNKQATWYVDPPYKSRGAKYKKGSKNLNYKKLGEWCLQRKGQIIVCECEPARWLDFVALRLTGMVNQNKNRYHEVVFERSEKKVGLLELL